MTRFLYINIVVLKSNILFFVEHFVATVVIENKI